MDIGKLLKNVNNLNQYVETTHDALENCKSSRMQLNLTSVLALKKIRSLEIEYFNKCEGNGLACIIIERLLLLPASKTWGVLGKELVNLLQYWLDAIRKHLIRHNVHWWSFLKLLIKFIKEIRVKDASLPNLLIEHTAECLLDLATLNQPDSHQKYEILHCFNVYCSESSREIRFALRNKFAPYFIKLAQYMASCGHLPTQYSVMEALIRWLLPRQDRTLRVMSANKWFPNHLYDDDTVNIFLERQWVNFFHDARDFLNSHNDKGAFITSVVCRKLTVGQLEIGTRRLESYLDINCVTRCVSVLLDPKVLETFATRHNGFETLVITHDNTETATLDRDSLQLKLSIRTITPPLAVPSYIPLGDHCDVIAFVTSHCDVTKLNNALRTVFVDKYQTTFDLDKEIVLSPVKPIEDGNRNITSEEENRFSLPVEAKTRKKSGYVQYSRQHRVTNLLSPSTASTSSLLHLREKLAALPKYRFEKEPVTVCVQPELSIVSEASETESLNTTLKKKHYGVISFQRKQDSDKKSQSDSESVKSVVRNKPRRLSPVIDEYGPSLLLYATIGSAGDSVIDDTVEQLTKNKDFDPESIVDLLVKEALQTPADETGNDSGINTAEKKLKEPDDEVNSETIENTPNTEVNVKKCIKNKSKIISSTSDESNTEGINNTPKCYINTRLKKKLKINTLPALDEQVVSKFFSQHTDKRNEIPMCPTLAKKINETSSETCDNFCPEECNLIADLQDNIEAEIFNNIDVIECLNHMVDKVCDELDKCTKYLGEDDNNTSDQDDDLPLREIINRIQSTKAKDSESHELKTTRAKKTKTIKLKYKSKTRKDNTRAKKGNKNIEPILPKMSTIIEADDTIIEKNIPENIENEPDKNQQNKDEDNVKKQILMDKVDVETPQIRRKRKLFSPKNDDTNKDNEIVVAEEERISGEFQIKKTPKKSLATCYKDIERERQNRIRMPRSRRSKIIESPISPRTKKMNDIFDQVKASANNETVTLADRTYEYDVYNLTSDSEDDFKQKKIAISKTSSVNSAKTTRRGRVIKPKIYDDKSTDECKPTKRKVTRKPRGKKQLTQNDLIDERMRKETEDLNTSIVIENTSNSVEEPKLILDVQPAMEIIEENESKPDCKKSKKKVTQNKVKRVQPSRQKQQLEVKYKDDDRTESPLPGLIVEAVPENKEDQDISADLVDKLKKIYQEGPETYINESNTTQNLLSDVERVNYSPGNVEMAVNMEEEEPEQMRQSQHKIRRNYKTAKGENTTTPLPKKECTKIDKYDPVEKSNPKQRVLKDITTDANNKHTNATSKIITRCNRNTAIDVINISEDVTSDKSIASIGITGHGDYEEAPPSLKLLAEHFKGRSLETENLDVSMKDYFEKLSQEIQKSNRSSSLDKDFRKISKNKPKSDDSVSSKSAVVQITRLTSDDISRWLPSNKNSSDSDSYVRETEQNTQKSSKDDKTLKSSQTKSKINKTSTNEYTKTTSETMDFDKIIQLHDESINGSEAKRKHDSNSTTKLQQYSKSNQNSTDNEESYDEHQESNRKSMKLIYKLSQLTKRSERCKNSDSENSDTSIKHTNKKNKPSVNTKLKCKTSKFVGNKSKEKVKLISNKDDSDDLVSSKSNRQNTSKNINTKERSKIRSTISPIILFDELISNADNQSCSLSDDENYMKEIIETFTKDTSQKRGVETKNIRNVSPEIEMAEEKSITSLSNRSKVTKREDSTTIKRKSIEEGGSRKKIRVLSEEGISASATTVSSVDDWFKRNDPIVHRVMGRSEALPEIIQPVLEKLDTTLVEINQRTSKEFVHLFVETQRDLTALNEQRYNLYKQTASDIMSEVIKLAVKVMDEKFSDLTRRSEELDKKFLIRQKERASRVIREDCKQKRAMVKLLREDVQAVVDHLQKQGEL